MFHELAGVAKSIRLELVNIYWVLLVPLVILLVSFEVLKSKEQKIGIDEILRRVVVSILLLLSFTMVTDAIGLIGDGIMGKLDKFNNSWEAFKQLGPNYEGSDKWFDIREYFIYAFALLSYLVAYLGFFMAEALTHFVWLILYVCSPLMILCYVPRQTAGVTAALYKGLVKVVVWKILWTILGALLLKLALNPQVTGMEDYLFSMILNLCIGISMLFIPIATKSLISDGMQGAASAIAAVPAAASAGFIKAKAARFAKQGGKKMLDGARFASRPMTNPVTGRLKVKAAELSPKIKRLKKRYSELNEPESYKKLKEKKKEQKNKQIRREYALKNAESRKQKQKQKSAGSKSRKPVGSTK